MWPPAVIQRARETGANQRFHSRRRRGPSSGPMPVTRTSLPAAGLVARVNRCSASRLCRAYRSSTARSTAGRHAELSTGGTANNTSRISSGEMPASSTTVTPTRTIQPMVPSSDMYMWSSTNTWLRSTESRSR